MISSVRVRLTALYGGIFVVFVAILLAISYWLMARHLDRTLGVDEAAPGAEDLKQVTVVVRKDDEDAKLLARYTSNFARSGGCLNLPATSDPCASIMSPP